MDGRALVAWNLRRLRVKRGFSQERLAYDAEVDRSYVGGLERHEGNPTVDVLDRLARTLDVTIGGSSLRSPGREHHRPKPIEFPRSRIALGSLTLLMALGVNKFGIFLSCTHPPHFFDRVPNTSGAFPLRNERTSGFVSPTSERFNF